MFYGKRAVEAIGLFILFCKNAVGCLHNPYITYRRLSYSTADIGQVVYIFLLVVAYFIFASLARVGLRNPYILTIQFNMLFLATLFGFLGMVIFLYYMGRMMKGTGSLKTIVLLYSYSLIPTLVWFFVTSSMYILIPPPRTLSWTGKLFSVVFSAFTLSAFLWKIILYYLTLRFGMRLELVRIAFVSLVLAPLLVGFSVGMYKMGIFRIPFI